MMSRSRSVSVFLPAVSLLLLTVVCEAQYYGGVTPSPDYDSDYNATFDYSFYSNTSNEELDRFGERFLDEEDTGGQQEDATTATMATAGRTTERGGFDVRSAASLPVSVEIRTLTWTLISLMALNTQQLQHTL